jgi:hypothetical protein
MATRADCDLRTALTVIRTVETGQTVAVGRVVADGNADHECQHTATGVDAIGVVVELGKLAGAAGDEVTIALLAGAAIVRAKVGTGGATRGKYAKCVADGVTDAVPDVATPAAMNVVGWFTQSGVAGDIVGMVPYRSWLTE